MGQAVEGGAVGCALPSNTFAWGRSKSPQLHVPERAARQRHQAEPYRRLLLRRRVRLAQEVQRRGAGQRSQAHAQRNIGEQRALPDTVDPEKLSAELADGVLTVKVAQQPKREPKKIAITPVAK